ncbi:glycoside hydrolase family 88/105 protein [Salinibacter ruber]|uniref:glycoside hydrolase family 88/105 protein n=1 Tax=Salinibacter ruber TaxID=146919 RepID=UPI003C6DEF82
MVLAVTLLGCDIGPTSDSPPPPISSEEVKKTMRSVRAYELAQLPNDRKLRGWSHCAFFVGMMASYRATGEQAYLDSTRRWGERNEWELGSRKRHADHQCVGQVYLELYGEEADERRMAPTRTVMDSVVSDPRPGYEAWDWADALFMAPPVLARMGTVTGEERYFDFLADQFWEASAPLYSSKYNLYYRDTRFLDRETEHGRKVFWSRGNGWVLTGIARVLQHLPADHPARPRFERRFRSMAAAVTDLQQESGFWRPSLLDPAAVPSRETSGTGFFCYALAWGINNQLLSTDRYGPVVRKAWRALQRSVNKQGRLGWVQPPGARPAPAHRSDTFAYGSGALLLAGSEIIKKERGNYK